MTLASFKQNFQDWITQQWVISTGKKINDKTHHWLLGPFGKVYGIGEKFITQLAIEEDLTPSTSIVNKGLLSTIHELNLSQNEIDQLSKKVIDFYENTSNYTLDLKAKWNPFFLLFGYALKFLFSNRIKQLNIPLKNKNASEIDSKIIQLIDKKNKQIKRTIWLRKFKDTNQIVYSGVYETCVIPNGKHCIKAVFPLPNGNATVILEPSVGPQGELVLTSSGNTIGDSGFYFLLKDSRQNLWTKYIKSFKDQLIVSECQEQLKADQIMTIYGFKVVQFSYQIKKINHK